MNIEKSLYQKALELIENSRYILLITHVNPDADSIGGALALSNFFIENRIKHKVFNVGKNIPRNVEFLNGYSKITDILPPFFDLAISVDCGAYSRLGIKLDENIPLINFDHHASNENFGTINLVDAKMASTSEIIFDFFKYNDLKISKNSAEALYTGIYSDTQALSLPRTTKETFSKMSHLLDCGVNSSYIAENFLRKDSLAKYRILPKILDSLELHKEGKVASIYAKNEWFKSTGAKSIDCEEALDMILRIGVVKIAFFIRELDKSCRISLRSKENIDVSKIAKIFNGGGHINAAGCTIYDKDLEEVKSLVLKEIYEI